MASTVAAARQQPAIRQPALSYGSGLVLVGLGLVGAVSLCHVAGSLPLMVAAVASGAILGNLGLVPTTACPGIALSSKTILRFGIVLLGLRLSFGDIAALGVNSLVVIAATVTGTFFGVQAVGRKVGLTPNLSLLIASGFSICGNSAIASVNGVAGADDEEVAAAVGLVTLCGTAAILVIPAVGAACGLSGPQLGVWVGAGVQDTAQVIAVAAAAGPSVLATATAVKLTRVLFLAPIVAGASIWKRRVGDASGDGRPALLPLFVVGFVSMMALRTSGVLPVAALDVGRSIEQYALAVGMVGLGTSVRVGRLRRLGAKPLLVGAVAWLIVGGISLAGTQLFI